jgi:PTH2 family peptidyl-tRNA hydrolase
MTPGKAASQAGHAYLNSYLACLSADPLRAREYQRDGLGTKVCLRAHSLESLLRAYDTAVQAGIPCALIEDQGCPDFYGGQPIITAVGFGPLLREESNRITKKFKLEP